MSFLSCAKANRAIVLCLFSIVVLLILALPVPSPVQNRVTVIGPTAAWAGSPDETLNPSPTPKKSARLTMVSPGASGRTISGRILFSMVWRMYWATVRL